MVSGVGLGVEGQGRGGDLGWVIRTREGRGKLKKRSAESRLRVYGLVASDEQNIYGEWWWESLLMTKELDVEVNDVLVP